MLGFTQRDNLGSLKAFEESTNLSRKIGEKRLLAQALSFIAMSRAFLGDGEAAYAAAEEALALAREVGDKVSLGLALSQMAGHWQKCVTTWIQRGRTQKKPFNYLGKLGVIGRLR